MCLPLTFVRWYRCQDAGLPAVARPTSTLSRLSGNTLVGRGPSFPRFLGICSLVLGFTLAACSTVRLAYENADWLVVTYASSYLDLTAQQKKQLRTGIRQALDKHRDEDLRSVVDFLLTTGAYVADGLTEPELDELTTTLMGFYETGIVKAVAVFAPTVADLSDAQVIHLSQELAEYNRDYRDKHLAISRSERLDERATLIVTHVEKWIGDLSPEQRDLVRGMSRNWPDLAQTWYDYDVAMQQELLGLLRAGVAVDEVQAHLAGWWLLKSGRSTELARQKDRLIEEVVPFVRALDSTFTPEQRQHLVKRIDGLADVLESLIPVPGAIVAVVNS